MCGTHFETLHEREAHWSANEIRPLGFGQKSYVLSIPSSMHPDSTLAASALEDAVQIVRARHPDITFSFIPYSYSHGMESSTLVAILAIPLTPLEGARTVAPPVDSRQNEELEKLRITHLCMRAFRGIWIQPARLAEAEMEMLLDRLSFRLKSEMQQLLVEHKNQPTKRFVDGGYVFNKELTQPIHGKHYRVASGTNRAGKHANQLWEVAPEERA